MYENELMQLFLSEEDLEMPTKDKNTAAKRRKKTAKYKKKAKKIEAIQSVRRMRLKDDKSAWQQSKNYQKKRSDRQASRIALNELL